MSMTIENQIKEMNKVKLIPRLDGFNGCTIRMAANYFNVDYQKVYSYVHKNKTKMFNLGMEAVTIRDVLSNGYICAGGNSFERNGKRIYFHTPYCEVLLLSKACMVELAKALSIVVKTQNVEPKSKDDEERSEFNMELIATENMLDIKSFDNVQFGNLRVVLRDGEPWFVAADVCKALDIDRTATRRLDDDEKGVYSTHTLGGKQEMTIVNEPGLYSLVLGSRKPEARAFKRWITHEVIPSIRKYGMYGIPNTNQFTAIDTKLSQMQDMLSALLKAYQDTNERLATLEKENITVHEANKKLQLTIDRKRIVTAIAKLMQTYAGKVKWGKFGFAWHELYARVLDQLGIDVYQRRVDAGNVNAKLIDMIVDSEILDVLRIAESTCREIGINTNAAIGDDIMKIINDVS